MYKIIIFNLLILTNALAFADNFFSHNKLLLSAALGYSSFSDQNRQILIISPYVNDLLTNNSQHHHLTYNLSAKRPLKVNSNLMDTVFSGFSFYFQQTSHSGDVWELLSPEFDNYDYRFKANTSHILFENDFYFKPILNKLYPFVTLGIGVGVSSIHYDDYATFNIPADSERHASSSETKLIYEIGTGLTVPINQHWGATFRYNYIKMGFGYVPNLPALKINLDSNNVLLGFNYSF